MGIITRITAEVPMNENEPTRCVIFDGYSKSGAPFRICDKQLIDLLQGAGHYPKGVLDRDAVA